jgi:hypothetical protein
MSQILQATASQKEALQLEQAFALILAKDYSQSYDILSELLTTKVGHGTEYLAHALCGLIRHTQWASVLLSKSKQGALYSLVLSAEGRYVACDVVCAF